MKIQQLEYTSSALTIAVIVQKQVQQPVMNALQTITSHQNTGAAKAQASANLTDLASSCQFRSLLSTSAKTALQIAHSVPTLQNA